MIWVAWVVVSCVMRELDRAGETDDVLLAKAEAREWRPLASLTHRDHPRADLDCVSLHPNPPALLAVDIPITIFSLGYYVINNPRIVLPVVAYYVPVFAGAVAFVVWNGGIVLGSSRPSPSPRARH